MAFTLHAVEQTHAGEYVKLDPKTLGVGSYQHDLDAKQLRRALDGAVEDAVSGVGVDANGASSALLERVAGLNATLAKAVAAARPFSSRNDLKRVKGLCLLYTSPSPRD